MDWRKRKRGNALMEGKKNRKNSLVEDILHDK